MRDFSKCIGQGLLWGITFVTLCYFWGLTISFPKAQERLNSMPKQWQASYFDTSYPDFYKVRVLVTDLSAHCLIVIQTNSGGNDKGFKTLLIPKSELKPGQGCQ